MSTIPKLLKKIGDEELIDQVSTVDFQFVDPEDKDELDLFEEIRRILLSMKDCDKEADLYKALKRRAYSLATQLFFHRLNEHKYI